MPITEVGMGPDVRLLHLRTDALLQDALVIGSRFEVDASKATCRLALYGRLAGLIDTSDPQQMRKLRIFKIKRRSGSIDRVNKDGLSAVCKSMFKKETDISVFAGLKVSRTRTSGFPLLAE